MTIVASALVDTGSRMDDVIFQEFKGTGNSEIVLDRFISERRIYPAVNIAESGTRNEQALVGDMEGEKINVLRRKLADLEKVEALEMLIKQMKNSPSNLRLLRSVKD
jgi:transcription termination factor Rho